jgi:septal ring factor EnvC (AmiA/AmiB activator)
MSDISSPTTNPQSFHHDDEHEHAHAKTPFGIVATCIILAVACAILGYSVAQRSTTISDLRTQLNQATSEITQLKTDGDQAKSQANGLKSQLDASAAQVSGLKGQLDQAQSQRTAIQAQLDKAKTDQSALQRQLDTDKTQIADVQGQLGQANDRVSAISKERDDAKAQAADLRSQLEKAQADASKPQAAAQSARTLPIATEFKKSFWGSTFVLHVTNVNADPVKVNITVTGAGSRPPVSTTINSGAAFDVKDLPAGANVVIAGDGFESVSLTAR